MQAGRELSHVLHSSEDVAQQRLGFEAPSSAGNPVEGKSSSVMFRSTGQKFDQAGLSSLPPSGDELVRRGYEAERMEFRARDLELAEHLKLRRTGYRGDVELFGGVDESLGIGFRVFQPIARVRVIPARRDQLFFRSCCGLGLENGNGLLVSSSIRRRCQATELFILELSAFEARADKDEAQSSREIPFLDGVGARLRHFALFGVRPKEEKAF